MYSSHYFIPFFRGRGHYFIRYFG